MFKLRLAAFALATATLGAPAFADEPAPEPVFVCTAEQVLGPLGAFLPITFSPEVAALFGVDPAECTTRLE